MSDTAYLFILAGIWSLVAVVVVRFIPKWPAKIAVFAVLVGVPFWELPYGYLNFQRLCGNEGKLQVFEPIQPQKSICVDYPFDSSGSSLVKFGFENVEARTKEGKVVRYPSTASAMSSKNDSKDVVSEFCVTFLNNNHLPWRVIRHDFVIARSRDRTVVARHSVFDWAGMWWQAQATPILGRGGECREDPVSPVMAVLLNGSK